jgi:secreted PhoX family phosphatase
MGDDGENECIYKFVADKPGTLRSGTLYVADFKLGRWLPLDRQQSKILRDKYPTHQDLMVATREAAKLIGGTPMDRPEGMARHPKTGQVIVSLTNNVDKSPINYFGSLLSIDEQNGDPLSLAFRHDTFVAGGGASGLACPDNVVFDKNGGLWVTTDISGKVINQGPYKDFGNNALFYIATEGPEAGRPQRIASAPIEAEFTGPCMMPDGETILLSVQHPGETSKSTDKPTSRWPDRKQPRSAVIAITGPAIKKRLKA